MGKYISSIKDLVILVMTNGSQVIYKANSGEPESCFQVGMMHLLGSKKRAIILAISR